MEDETKIENTSRKPIEKEKKKSYAIRLTDMQYQALVKDTGKEKTELLRFVIDDWHKLKNKIIETEITLREGTIEIIDLKGDNDRLRQVSSDKDQRIQDIEGEKEQLSRKVREREAALNEQKRLVDEANRTIENYKGWNNKSFLQNEHLRISNRYAKGALLVFLMTWIFTIAFAVLHISVILEYAEGIMILALAITAISSIISLINVPEKLDLSDGHFKH